jgi:hypothetical protein
MYVERNGRRPPRDTWSFRQTGVVHKFSREMCSSQIVVLHPNNEAVAQTKLEALAESSHKAEVTQHPLNVHLVIIWSYLANWQDYIESLASDLEQIVSGYYTHVQAKLTHDSDDASTWPIFLNRMPSVLSTPSASKCFDTLKTR